jgi:hypothetical protein
VLPISGTAACVPKVENSSICFVSAIADARAEVSLVLASNKSLAQKVLDNVILLGLFCSVETSCFLFLEVFVRFC